MTLRRYDLRTNYRCGDAIEEMEPSEDGDWVRYEDVAAVVSDDTLRALAWEHFPESESLADAAFAFARAVLALRGPV